MSLLLSFPKKNLLQWYTNTVLYTKFFRSLNLKLLYSTKSSSKKYFDYCSKNAVENCFYVTVFFKISNRTEKVKLKKNVQNSRHFKQQYKKSTTIILCPSPQKMFRTKSFLVQQSFDLDLMTCVTF